MAECFWSVHVSKGSRIQLTIVDIDLEAGSCSADYVRIYDGINSRANSLGQSFDKILQIINYN